MNKLIEHLSGMKQLGLIKGYALGGATALVYYFEPVQTQDIDVFILLSDDKSPLVNLSPIYSYLAENGVSFEKEYVLISGIPVQLLVPYNSLVQEAVITAPLVDFMDTKVHIPTLEYLMAIMVQTGRAKDKARLDELFKFPNLFDVNKFENLLERFSLTEKWLDTKKWITSI